MRPRDMFMIESESSRRKLLFDGREISTFATLGAAEAEANKIAKGLAG